jgi:hypothetical protein
MPKIAGGHGPKLLRNLDVGSRRLLQTAAFHQAHGTAGEWRIRQTFMKREGQGVPRSEKEA